MLEVLLGGALVVTGSACFVLAGALRAAGTERQQLQRMAFAEDKAERIAALLPPPAAHRQRAVSAAGSPAPRKPEGL